jgi:hypothetical protein
MSQVDDLDGLLCLLPTALDQDFEKPFPFRRDG